MAADSPSESPTVEKTVEDIRKNRGFFGHPKGVGVLALGNLCNTAAWGAFYAVFIFYLYTPWIKGLGFSHGDASMLVTALGVGNSILGIVGSWLADRVLGMRKALILGNMLKALGFFMFAIPVLSIGLGRTLAFIGILCLSFPIMGSSNYSLTGQLYSKDDDIRRDSAFTIYNIVTSLANLIIPAVTAQIGLLNYHIGFAIAGGFALLYGLVIFVTQYKFFGPLGEKPIRPLNHAERVKFIRIALGVITAMIVIGLVVALLKIVSFKTIMDGVSGMAFIIPVVFLVNLFHKKNLTTTDNRHLKGFLWLYIGQIAYYLGTALLNTSVLVFIDEKIQRRFWNITVAPGSIQTVYAILGLIISPAIILLWNKTNFGKMSTTSKFSGGFLMYALGFLMLALPLYILPQHGRYNLIWIVLFYLFVSICDVLFGAVGFSTVAKLSPLGEDTQMQTAWSLGATISNGIVLVSFSRLQSVSQQMSVFPVLAVLFAIIFAIFMVNRNRIERLIA